MTAQNVFSIPVSLYIRWVGTCSVCPHLIVEGNKVSELLCCSKRTFVASLILDYTAWFSQELDYFLVES